MKKILIILISITLIIGCGSETEIKPNNLTWEKLFGEDSLDDQGKSVQQTNDGGYIVCGSTYSYGYEYGSSYLIKTDENGNEEWSKFGLGGGSNYESEGLSIKKTNDGGYVMLVVRRDLGGLNPVYKLIKINENGLSNWGVNLNLDIVSTVQQTIDGGYIVIGSTYTGFNNGSSSYNTTIVKTNENGQEIWNNSFGENYDCRGVSIEQTSEGGYILCGRLDSEIYLIKIDENGQEIFTNTYQDGYIGRSVKQTIDGGYIVLGHLSGYGTNLIKTNNNGQVIWISSLESSFYTRSVIQTHNDDYIIIGEDSNGILLVKTNDNGQEIWRKNYYGTGSLGYDIQETNDDGYIICGLTRGENGWYTKDLYLSKTDENGNIN